MNEYNQTWEYYLSKIDEQDKIEETEKQELHLKWNYLRDIFGENWFKEEKYKIHSFKRYFYNRAPWSLRWIGELGEMIRVLKEKENSKDILDRLRLNDSFEEAYYELRAGYSLFKLDISFGFLRRAKKKKTPDIVMSIDGREICLEITEKNNPEDPLNSLQNFHEISLYFIFKRQQIGDEFNAYFDILKPISTSTTKKIIEICENLFEKVKVSGFEEFHIPNTIDVYIIKEEKIDGVPQEKRVMRSKTPHVDELSRIRGTIITKEKQLRAKHPNVLLIFDSMLNPLDNKELFYSKFVDALEETVYQFSNLSAVMIYIETYYIGHRLSPPVIPEPMSTDMGIKCLA